jgi:hypothetical protein
MATKHVFEGANGHVLRAKIAPTEPAHDTVRINQQSVCKPWLGSSLITEGNVKKIAPLEDQARVPHHRPRILK